jgi:hypothetical protein
MIFARYFKWIPACAGMTLSEPEVFARLKLHLSEVDGSTKREAR